MASIKLPDIGFVFWPVGNGDSTTIILNAETMMQVDLCHRTSAEDKSDPKTAIVDKLIEILPKVDGKPYLSVYALTHPDEDHCCGFEQLIEKVTIGELWFTPRIFEEEDTCEDAGVFFDQAMLRVQKNIENNGKVESGDRVRIIGYSERLEEEDFKGFPKELLTIPGNAVTGLDGDDYKAIFQAFIHAPFKDDAEGERNNTSLGMQVTLSKEAYKGQALLFGDLKYPVVQRIFKETKDKANLAWNVLLSPHHCSKSTMHWDSGNGEEYQKDVMENFSKNAVSPTYIIGSCNEFPDKDEDGQLPPHLKARRKYEEITDSFFCTAEIAPDPIIFGFTGKGFQYQGNVISETKPLASSVETARGTGTPPKTMVGFGNDRKPSVSP